MNLCSKPSCSRPGAVALGYDYAARTAMLAYPPEGEISPHYYPLCTPCAEALRPPLGWELVDLRASPSPFASESDADVRSLDDRLSTSPPDNWRLFGHSA